MKIVDRDGNEVTCKNHGKNYRGECRECKHPIIIHCPDCQLQITGCLCTLKRKMALEQEEQDRLMGGGIHD